MKIRGKLIARSKKTISRSGSNMIWFTVESSRGTLPGRTKLIAFNEIADLVEKTFIKQKLDVQFIEVIGTSGNRCFSATGVEVLTKASSLTKQLNFLFEPVPQYS